MVTALEIYQNKLYYLNANRLYESNIDGSDRKLVADADKLKGFEDEINGSEISSIIKTKYIW